jgi:xanthine dehydrogenase small subunit
MIQFILNNQVITTESNPGMTLLDFIRYEKNLKGTKIGCREGDCGACTVLVGRLDNKKVEYNSITSCLSPLGNAHGKHIVTIEGLNRNHLTPYQQAMVDESGSQCGFCTPGFIVSFASECLANRESSFDDLISAIDGNICRCTGYKSIERAASIVHKKLLSKSLKDPIEWLINEGFIPAYFSTIPNRLSKLQPFSHPKGEKIVGGGTDLYVQKPDEMLDTRLNFVSESSELSEIREENNYISIGAATNTTQLLESEIMKSQIPNIRTHLKLVSSTPIRNMATLAGNLVNASPIGDLSIIFLALDSRIRLLNSNGDDREIALKDFYKGYKILAKADDELITHISFQKPKARSYFNFEKVSKRKYLDIASVNSAIHLKLSGQKIIEAHVSAGGVAPIPKYLEKTSRYLENQELTESTVRKAADVLANEISPISDVRGSMEYKRLLLRQLFFAHFIELFPSMFKIKALV